MVPRGGGVEVVVPRGGGGPIGEVGMAQGIIVWYHVVGRWRLWCQMVKVWGLWYHMVEVCL